MYLYSSCNTEEIKYLTYCIFQSFGWMKKKNYISNIFSSFIISSNITPMIYDNLSLNTLLETLAVIFHRNAFCFFLYIFIIFSFIIIILVEITRRLIVLFLLRQLLNCILNSVQHILFYNIATKYIEDRMVILIGLTVRNMGICLYFVIRYGSYHMYSNTNLISRDTCVSMKFKIFTCTRTLKRKKKKNFKTKAKKMAFF